MFLPSITKGHGRIETRLCETIDDIQWLKELHPKWKNLNSVAKVTCIRRIGSTETTATRYYIANQRDNAKMQLERARNPLVDRE